MQLEQIDLEEQFVLLQPEIKRAAAYFLGCNTFTDDILQDVFLELLKKKNRFRRNSSFKTYVMAITRHVSYRYVKRIAKQKKLHTEYEKRMEPVSVAESVVDTEKLNSALKKLTPKHREALLLKEMEHYSYQEIAQIMKINVGTVKFRISYAKKKLVKNLNRMNKE